MGALSCNRLHLHEIKLKPNRGLLRWGLSKRHCRDSVLIILPCWFSCRKKSLYLGLFFHANSIASLFELQKAKSSL